MSASYVTEADTVRALEGGGRVLDRAGRAAGIDRHGAGAAARAAPEALRDALVRERARATAESASRTKDDFLATLFHELRSPLNAILSWVRVLRTDRLDAKQQKRALEIIERNTRQQVKMIEELLDVSRIVSGKMRLELQLVDIAPSSAQHSRSCSPSRTRSRSIWRRAFRPLRVRSRPTPRACSRWS